MFLSQTRQTFSSILKKNLLLLSEGRSFQINTLDTKPKIVLPQEKLLSGGDPEPLISISRDKQLWTNL